MKLISLFLLYAISLLGQDYPKSLGQLRRYYSATCNATLSSAATACTVQQPASGAQNVRLVRAQVYCSVACSITQERNGTAATATAVTIKLVNPDKTDAATAKAWSASDVGVGTALSTLPLPAGLSSITFDGVYLIGSGTAKNYTIRTNSITGDVTIVIQWEEYN